MDKTFFEHEDMRNVKICYRMRIEKKNCLQDSYVFNKIINLSNTKKVTNTMRKKNRNFKQTSQRRVNCVGRLKIKYSNRNRNEIEKRRTYLMKNNKKTFKEKSKT